MPSQAVVDGSLPESRMRELVDQAYDSWSRYDVAAIPAIYHPEHVFDFSDWEGWVGEPRYVGCDGLERLWEEYLQVWFSWRGELELVERAADGLVVVATQYGKTAASEPEVQVRYGQLFAFRDGLIVISKVFFPRGALDEARRSPECEVGHLPGVDGDP